MAAPGIRGCAAPGMFRGCAVNPAAVSQPAGPRASGLIGAAPGMFRGCAVNPAAVSQPLPGMVGAAQPTGRGCFGAAQSIRRRFRSPCRGYSGLRSPLAGDIRGCAVNPAAVSQPAGPRPQRADWRSGMIGAAQPTGRGCFGAAQSIRRRFRSPCRGCFGAAQPTGRGYSGLRSQSGGGFAAYQ